MRFLVIHDLFEAYNRSGRLKAVYRKGRSLTRKIRNYNRDSDPSKTMVRRDKATKIFHKKTGGRHPHYDGKPMVSKDARSLASWRLKHAAKARKQGRKGDAQTIVRSVQSLKKYHKKLP